MIAQSIIYEITKTIAFMKKRPILHYCGGADNVSKALGKLSLWVYSNLPTQDQSKSIALHPDPY